jgi:hypothetical protein
MTEFSPQHRRVPQPAHAPRYVAEGPSTYAPKPPLSSSSDSSSNPFHMPSLRPLDYAGLPTINQQDFLGIDTTLYNDIKAHPLPFLSPQSPNNRDARVYTKIEMEAYRPKEFYTQKLWAWLQIQGRNLLDVPFLNKKMIDSVKAVNGGQAVQTVGRDVYELMNLGQIDDLGQRASIEAVAKNPTLLAKQVATQGGYMKTAFKSWTASPGSFFKGTGHFLHGSFTKPFMDLAAGNNVVGLGLSAAATFFFGVDIASKTYRAHKSAYNEGERGGELAKSTATEFVKETAKGGGSWIAGSIGASLVGRTIGTTIESIPQGSWMSRFKSLPMRGGYILGAVLFGSTVKAVLDRILPSRPIVDKLTLEEVRQEMRRA